MAFSAGFSPHPRISYANAAPTGVASEAEFVEIALVREVDPQRLLADLDAALPPGLDVIDAVIARTPDFAQRLEASRWCIALPGVAEADLARAVALLEATDSLVIERMTQKGRREVDVRASLLHAAVSRGEDPGEPCAILHVVVRSATPTVRPDDVLAALRSVADLVPPIPPRVTREMQGPLGDDGITLGDPLAPDRDDAAGWRDAPAPAHPDSGEPPKT